MPILFGNLSLINVGSQFLLNQFSQSLLKEWENLYQTAQHSHPFQSPAWVLTWHETHSSHKPLQFVTEYEGKDLVAVLPVVQTPLWVRPSAMGPSDYLSPLAKTPESLDKLQFKIALFSEREPVLLPRQPNWSKGPSQSDPQMLSFIPEGHAFQLHFDKSFEDYSRSLSKSLRADLRKGAKCSSFRIKTFRNQECLEAIDDFVRLHRARWRSKRQPGAFPNSRVRFHKAAIANGLNVELHFAFWNEEPIAAIYLLTDSKTVYFYQAGMASVDIRRRCGLSPGSLLIYSAIHDAYESGAQTFDFLRGTEAYKLRWKPNGATPLSACLWAPRNTGGNIARAVFSASYFAEQAVRNRLESGSRLLSPVPIST